MMMETPLVSVVIPCYNSDKYITDTIESVLAQTYNNIEIIVVDDGSTDESFHILQQYEANGHIRLLHHENRANCGVSKTRKMGINATIGEYIALLDSDDVFDKYKISQQVAVLVDTETAVMCHTGVKLIEGQSSTIDTWFNIYNEVTQYKLKNKSDYLEENHICNSSVMVKAQVLRQLNADFEQLFQFEDWVLWILLSEHGDFVYLPDKLLEYRYHSESATYKVHKSSLLGAYSHIEFYLSLLAKCDDRKMQLQVADKLNDKICHLIYVYAGGNRGNHDERASNLINSWRSSRSRIIELENEIANRNQRLAEKVQQLAERDQQLHERNQQLAERDQQLHERNQQLAERDGQLAERDQQLAEKDRQIYESQQQITNLLNSMSWKITAPLRSLGSIVSHKSKSAKNIANNLCLLGSEKPVFKAHEVKILQPIQENRPRIVHALGNFMTGGSSQLVVDLIERLGHIYEQEVIVCANPPTPSYVGVPVHEYRTLPSPDKIIKYFQRYRPSLVHVHYWGSTDKDWYEQVFLAADKYGCQVIENINTPVQPYVGDVISHYVYVSNYVYKTFGEQNDKSSIIYPGSNLEVFKRSTINIPDNCIGMVYRLEKDKLSEQSIDVFIKVAKQRPCTKILIVGGGSLLEPYKEAVKAADVYDAFVFSDYVAYQNLPALYEQMSIFVAPVWQESFGQVTPFAMNMGIAVVGYDIGALSEILGTKELLASPGDSDKLAEIIVNLLDNRKQRLAIGAYNRARAQKHFSVETMVSSYGKLYKKLLEAGK